MILTKLLKRLAAADKTVGNRKLFRQNHFRCSPLRTVLGGDYIISTQLSTEIFA